ncbi:MAG TPA: cytochrome c biogenesis protein CcsA [Bacteroidia bacterium]|nr:cytochrome c biogenesis protein CcsA [Bacteroidia bacterium]
MNIQYIGEHLLPGQFGNLFLVLSFTAALLSCIAYYFASNQNNLENNSWKSIGRTAFYLHGLSVFAVMGILFYIIFNHYFEYQYVWQHSSKSLPIRYMLSCFWEGQEGSFLLWSIWHVILGFILMRKTGNFEAPVMTVFSSVQVFLSSMLLGIYIGDYHLGSNPFILLREHPEYMELPFVKVPEYLTNLDGRGLNPLLQNYWMTIHPPILFLGFASTLVPFAFAMAGLWKKQHNEWVTPALPWTYFGVMILGTGILMGGAWAYESLSFGGFWAWDPVENASLVPWLVMVGGAHVMLIYKSRKQSLFTAYVLVILTFILILYSTFLTRSGILGNTSVHAFTDLGMSGQLLVYLLFYVVIAAFLLIINYKSINVDTLEDNSTSREFWMFIAALVLLISSFQITFTTSIPVINKLFGSNLAPPTKVVEHYNSWQIPFAIIVALLMALTQFLKYKQSDLKITFKKLIVSLSIAIVVTAISIFALELYNGFLIALFFASFLAITTNIDYIFKVLNGEIKKAGASVAHIGFGMILLGALIATGKSRVISQNTSGIDISKLGKEFNNMENIMLAKHDTLQMGEYFLSYKGRRIEGVNHYFDIDYFQRNEKGKYELAFTLSPIVQTNPRMGNSAEPDTKHYLHKDVYTHITYAEMEQHDETNHNHNNDNGYKPFTSATMAIGDTIFGSKSLIVLEKIYKETDSLKYHFGANDIAVGATFKIIDIHNKVTIANPIYLIKGNVANPIDAEVENMGIKLSFKNIHPDNGKIDIDLSEKDTGSQEFIILKAIVFPYINILWLGCVIMIIGTVLAIRERLKKSKFNIA